MRKQVRGVWLGWCCAVAVSLALAFPNAAMASPLYLGLPNGRTLGYDVADGEVTRARGADIPDVGSYAFPTLVDLDADGDQDVLVGQSGGFVRAFRNEGTDGAPRWLRQPSWEPGVDLGADAAPAAGDLDRDGDPDLLVGTRSSGIRGFENIGSRSAPRWRERSDWAVGGFDSKVRPALGDIDDDGRLDLVVGLRAGDVRAYRGAGDGSFREEPGWSGPYVGDRVAPALGDLDGDGRSELLLTDGLASSDIFQRVGGAWVRLPIDVPDPGSGPAGPALRLAHRAVAPPAPDPTPAPTGVPGPATPQPTTVPPGSNDPPAGGPGDPGVPGAPVAMLQVAPPSGPAPLAVQLDARGSHDPDGDSLSFAWDFGDGSGGEGTVDDPAGAIRQARTDYGVARRARDAKRFEDAVRLYLALVERLLPLTGVTTNGPVKQKGTRRIDRVARWYLQKIAHDLGGIYLYRDLGLPVCERYELALQFSRESATQAVRGGFPALPASNGTKSNIKRATKQLQRNDCPLPDPAPMFPERGIVAGPVVVHEYLHPGSYVARVVVSDGARSAVATATIVVGSEGSDPAPVPTPTRVPTQAPTPGPLPTSDPGPVPPPAPPGDVEPYEGFGAGTRGGAGGREIRIRTASESAVRAAFEEANDGHARIVFDVTGPIEIRKPLPRLTGDYLTIEGQGATLVGTYGSTSAATVDIRGHDVIVRNLRLRNGGDNLRVQGSDARDVVISHVSSTGAADDGLSIGYGARDVTVQYSFFAGNTRSIFLKYRDTTNVSIHHSWIMKQWIRGPLVSDSIMVDLRNLIVEDWTSWGARFERNSRGNLVNSLFRLGAYARSIGGKTGSALRLQQSGPVFTAGNSYQERAAKGDVGGAAAPLDAPPVTTHGLTEMVDLVEARAGCLPRDAIDRAYIETTTGWSTKKTTPYRPTP